MWNVLYAKYTLSIEIRNQYVGLSMTELKDRSTHKVKQGHETQHVPSISAHVVPQSADSVALRDHGREKGGMDRREEGRMRGMKGELSPAGLYRESKRSELKVR